jgi:hypothetical protein
MTDSNGNRGVFIRKVGEPPEKASQSLLARIDVCPYSGALYLDYKGGPQTAAMARGEAFHSFAEQATNMLINEGETNMPPEVAKDLMQAILEDRTDLALPAHEHEACRIMAWNWGSAMFIEPDQVLCNETMVELEVGMWKIRGRIDLALSRPDGIEVIDYKTSLALPTAEQYEGNFQGLDYSLMIAEGVPEGETAPLGKGVATFYRSQLFPRYTDKDGSLVRREAVADRAQLHDFKRTIESHLEKLTHGLATGEWAASPGSHCVTCPASSECPIPADLRDVKTIGTEGDALEVAQRIRFTEKDLKDDKAALKLYVDENGELRDGDEVWGFTYSESEVAKDKDAIKQALADAGQDPAHFYSLRKSTRFGKKKAVA